LGIGGPFFLRTESRTISLRTRFIALSSPLAVVPLVGVGFFSYVRSMRAVEALIATQVEDLARTAARRLEERYAVQESNLQVSPDQEVERVQLFRILQE
jgi:hypothetical protein